MKRGGGREEEEEEEKGGRKDPTSITVHLLVKSVISNN